SPRLSLLRIPHYSLSSFFFFTDTAPTEIYTLSLHELFRSAPRHPVHGAAGRPGYRARPLERPARRRGRRPDHRPDGRGYREPDRSEEHTSELQSPYELVCRLLLEKKKKNLLTLEVLPWTIVLDPRQSREPGCTSFGAAAVFQFITSSAGRRAGSGFRRSASDTTDH